MDAPSPRGGDDKGGHAGCGYLRCPTSEHCCAIYCDKAHYGPVSGGGATPRSAGFGEAVGTVGTKSGGDTRGGAVGGGEEGLGGADGIGGGGRDVDGKLRQKGYCSG